MNNNRIWVLIGKKANGEATTEELAELEVLMRNDQFFDKNYHLLNKVAELKIQSTPEELDFESSWNQLSANIILQVATQGENHYPKKAFNLFSLKPMLAAAVVLVFLSVGIVIYKFGFSNNNLALPQNEIATKAGSKTNIILPDGTKVWLNAGSRITYQKDFLQNREVVLTGEAFFDVAHQDNNTFVLHSGNVNIKVLGTAFNVKAYPKDNRIETSLLRGSIELTTTNDPERKILLRPNEKISITNYKKIAVNAVKKNIETLKNDVYTIETLSNNKKINALAEIAWLDDKMVFTSESFKSLAERMSVWYGVDIQINDAKIENLKFTGVFDRLNIVQAIQTLEFSCNNKFIYNINKNSINIKPNRLNQ